MRGAPSSRAAAGAGSKGSASSRLRARDGGGRGGGISLGVGLEGVGAGFFLHPAAGSRSGRGGETAGGSPWRGWRRRCRRRRNRRGGCRCRSFRRRHSRLLRPRRGASERAKAAARSAAHTTAGSLTPTSSLGPASPQPASQPIAARRRHRAACPLAGRRGSAGGGAPGENHSWNPVPTPKPRTAPLSSSRPGVRSRRPEPMRRLPRPNPLSYWPLGSLGLPWRKPREIGVFGAGSWDGAARPHRILCPRPFNWTIAGGRGSALGGPGGKGRQATRGCGA